MKKILLMILTVFTMTNTSEQTRSLDAENMKVKVIINNKEFVATLSDSEATKEFISLLPMEVNMGEHNGNEKYYNLPNRISGKSINQGTVNAGDLMVWALNTLVLFYADGRTSYSYINLGNIKETAGLREAVGKGNVKVKFELVKDKKINKN